MKKFIVLSALAAVASTAFVACSSDDDLVSQNKGAEITDTKCPFNFVVSMDNGNYTRGAGAEVASDMVVSEDMDITRASVISTNPFGANGAGFNLYGFHGSDMMWSNSKAYSFDGSNWTGEGKWPSTSGNCYFYAISNAGNSFPVPSTNPTDATGASYDAVSFDYELPNSGGALTLATQEDLLVAHSVTKTGDVYGTALVGQTSGNVNLAFKHALSNIELKMIFPSDVWQDVEGGKYEPEAENVAANYFIYIKSITIRNLPVAGTYTFGSATPWGIKGTTRANAVFTWPKGILLPAVSYVAEGIDPKASDRKALEHALYTNIATGNASIMIIPHTANTVNAGFTASESANKLFIEVNGFIGSQDNQNLTLAQAWSLIQEAIAQAQTGDTWPVDWNSVITGYTEAVYQVDEPSEPYYTDDTDKDGEPVRPVNGEVVQISTNTDFQPDPNVVGFYCGTNNGTGGTNAASAYIPFTSSTITFSENKKYTLYLNLAHLLKADGNVVIEPAP